MGKFRGKSGWLNTAPMLERFPKASAYTLTTGRAPLKVTLASLVMLELLRALIALSSSIMTFPFSEQLPLVCVCQKQIALSQHESPSALCLCQRRIDLHPLDY